MWILLLSFKVVLSLDKAAAKWAIRFLRKPVSPRRLSAT